MPQFPRMTREQLEVAVREGIPFKVNMADGKEYTVKSPFNIAFDKNTVVVIDEEGLAHVLPMLTMTGISYLKKAA
jgi:hypothetical protein